MPPTTTRDAQQTAEHRTEAAACDHKAATPHFDHKKARGMAAHEIRRNFPRGTKCPTCGAKGAFYASLEH